MSRSATFLSSKFGKTFHVDFALGEQAKLLVGWHGSPEQNIRPPLYRVILRYLDSMLPETLSFLFITQSKSHTLQMDPVRHKNASNKFISTFPAYNAFSCFHASDWRYIVRLMVVAFSTAFSASCQISCHSLLNCTSLSQVMCQAFISPAMCQRLVLCNSIQCGIDLLFMDVVALGYYGKAVSQNNLIDKCCEESGWNVGQDGYC